MGGVKSRFLSKGLRNCTQGSPHPSKQGPVQDRAQGWQSVGGKAAPRPGKNTMEHRLLKSRHLLL